MYPRDTGSGAMEKTALPRLTGGDGPLLATKLHMPRPGTRLVRRTLLNERLIQGLAGAMTLISASAGFGKTTLLCDWLTESKTPVAWLSLETADNELVRFLTYLIAALQTLNQEIGDASLTLLQSSPSARVDSILTLLINDLEDKQLPRFALVLDDYHVIEATEIHHAITFLLEHQSPMHLVIATRADPPLPLARLRARRQLCEIRALDLRFATEEVASFLRIATPLALSQCEVALLQRRTEGWITGIQLAALSLQGRTDISTFLAAFSGSHRFVLDYLSEEVFFQQTEAVQSFLLHTCILDRLNGSLADAVTETTHGQAMLEALEHSNLFVVSLDDQREWYRYHHLFAEVLRGRLQQTQPDNISGLHRRASRWYEQHGFLDSAIEHALAGADYPLATRLIEQAAREALRSQSRFTTLLRRMEALPKAWLDTHPQLALLYAWIVVSSGVRPWSDIELWLQGAYDLLPPYHPQVTEFAGVVAAIRTMAAAPVEEHIHTIELSSQSLALLPADHWARGLMMLYRGGAFLSLEQVDEAIATLRQAVALNEADASQQHVFLAKSLLANAHVLAGHLHQAMHLYQEVLQQEPKQHVPLRSLLLAHGGLGNLLRERNDFSSALVHLEAGRQLDHYVGGILPMVWAVYLPLARVYLAQGKQEEAFAALSHIQEIARASTAPHSLMLISTWQAHFHLMTGDVDAAAHWAQEHELDINAIPNDLTDSGLHEMKYITLARLTIAQGGDALPLLEQLLASADKAHRTASVLELLLLQSLACETIGQRDKALIYLEQALLQAEPEGYIRLFVDQGKPLIQLLLHLQDTNPAQSAYIQRLLAASNEQETTRPQNREQLSQPQQPLVDPLSVRELEVLRLIGT